METVIVAIAAMAGMLAAFRMGYRAGQKDDRLLAPDPDIDISVDPDEAERAPTHDEIMEDMKRSRTIMTGFDFEEN